MTLRVKGGVHPIKGSLTLTPWDLTLVPRVSRFQALKILERSTVFWNTQNSFDKWRGRS